MIARFVVNDRNRWELVIGALLVALATVLIAAGSFFHRDDFVYAEFFQLNPITPQVFLRSWFGHFVPGYIAFLTAFLSVFGLSWSAALFVTALINVGAFVAVARALDAVVGTARFNVIAALAFTLSLGPLTSRLWWAATLTNMLALALGLAVLGCATRWVTHRRRRHLVAALALYVVALAMSEKNLLFSLHIGLWCVLVVWRGLPVSERLRNILKTWPLWAGLVVISAVEVVVFLTGGYVEESGSSPSLPTSLAFILDSVMGGLIPSLFGLDMEKVVSSLLDPRVVATTAIFLAFIVWTVLRDRSNLGVWAFALIGVLANVVAVSRRADILGPTGGRNLRYLLESSALLWLTIGVVLVVALRAGMRRSEPPETTRSGRPLRVGVGIAGVVIFVLSTWSWSHGVANAIDRNEGRNARAWVESLRASLPHPAPPLIDSPLPESFGLPPLHPYDMVAAALPSLGWKDVRTTTSIEGAWVVGPDGSAGPATMADPEVALSDTQCSDGSTNIAVPQAHSDGRKFVVLSFSRASGTSVAFLFRDGWTTIERPEQSGTVAVYIPGPIGGDLQVNTQGGTMCVDSVTIADIVPHTPQSDVG